MIPTKWEFIIENLERLEAPDKIIESAKNINQTLEKEYGKESTPYWVIAYTTTFKLLKDTILPDYLKGIVADAELCIACVKRKGYPCEGNEEKEPCILYEETFYDDIDCCKDFMEVYYWLKEEQNKLDIARKEIRGEK